MLNRCQALAFNQAHQGERREGRKPHASSTLHLKSEQSCVTEMQKEEDAPFLSPAAGSAPPLIQTLLTQPKPKVTLSLTRMHLRCIYRNSPIHPTSLKCTSRPLNCRLHNGKWLQSFLFLQCWRCCSNNNAHRVFRSFCGCFHVSVFAFFFLNAFYCIACKMIHNTFLCT